MPVRVEVLSDYVGEQVAAANERLQGTGSELMRQQAALLRTVGDLRRAQAAKRWWQRLLRTQTDAEREVQQRAEELRTAITRLEADEHMLAHRRGRHFAGATGEDRLADALSDLPDTWLLLRGYRNRGGETDQVLVGPAGVWAIEVKYRPGRLAVDGGDWRLEKVDGRGDAVSSKPATDGGGRTWGDQVNDVAGGLSAWLQRNDHAVPVRTAVMLMHDRARVGRTQDSGVDLVSADPRELLRELQRSGLQLTPDQCQRIADLIRRDHRYHAGRRSRRR